MHKLGARDIIFWGTGDLESDLYQGPGEIVD